MKKATTKKKRIIINPFLENPDKPEEQELNPPKIKNVGGAPTLYRPEFCDYVEEWGRQGFSKAMIAEALSIVRQTIDEWVDKYPEFSNSMLRARDYSLAWWESQGNSGIWGGKEFNANAYRLQMCNRFKEDWKPENSCAASGDGKGDQLHELAAVVAASGKQ